jgi:hypothetical protein
MDNPYEVAKWLAHQFSDGGKIGDNVLFMWAGRAAQPIDSVRLDGDVLRIKLSDIGEIQIADGGQSCCESRYMTCDDDLTSFAGARLVHMDLEAGDNDAEGEYGECHEQRFLKVRTTNGDFTVCTHNVHNGYYGGFNVALKWVDA